MVKKPMDSADFYYVSRQDVRLVTQKILASQLAYHSFYHRLYVSYCNFFNNRFIKKYLHFWTPGSLLSPSELVVSLASVF